MKKFMFKDRYGLTQAVLEGKKTMTRREVKLPNGMTHSDIWNPVMGIDDKGKVYFTFDCIDSKQLDIYPLYRIGEEVSIAQKYWDLRNCDAFYEALQKADSTFPLECIRDERGCDNKMFVKADWMPHRIRFTNIKAERLQDISEEDIMREGIMEGEFMNTWDTFYFDEWGDVPNHITFKRPHDAFRNLIDRISGKGTWQRNPWVFAYEFELIK